MKPTLKSSGMKPKLKRKALVVYPALAAPPKSAVAALPYPMAGSVTFADLTSLELKMLYCAFQRSWTPVSG